MQLTITDNKAIQAVSENLRPVLVARLKTPLKSISELDLEIKIKNMILVAYTELGINTGDKNSVISFLRQTLLKDFRGPKYQHLSFEIIEMFVSNGIRGHYGTFKNQLNTVNVQNIHHWINEGLKSEDYKRSLTEFNQAVLQLENKVEGKDTALNPEGIKRLTTMLKEGLAPILAKEQDRKIYKSKPLQKSDRDIFIQEMMNEFEKIRKVKPGVDEVTRKELPGMFIQFEGRAIDLTEFLTIKLTEYDTNTPSL